VSIDSRTHRRNCLIAYLNEVTLLFPVSAPARAVTSLPLSGVEKNLSAEWKCVHSLSSINAKQHTSALLDFSYGLIYLKSGAERIDKQTVEGVFFLQKSETQDIVGKHIYILQLQTSFDVQ
jgi:hypothetical protein